MAKYVKLENGKLKEQGAINASTGATDAAKIAELDSNGRFDSSLMPVGFGSETKTIVASEALSSGDFVNVFNDTGTVKVRKADASVNSKQAHGFVLASVLSAASATVYYGNLNNQVTGFTVGAELYLSDTVPGAATATPVTTGAGKISQRVGVATATGEILVEIQQPIEIA